MVQYDYIHVCQNLKYREQEAAMRAESLKRLLVSAKKKSAKSEKPGRDDALKDLN